MKLFVALFFLVFICAGCKKENSPENGLGGFPGSLDSVLYYNNTTDSANFSGGYAFNNYQYDDQQRVRVIQFGLASYRIFYYMSTDKLPYLQADSIVASYPPAPDNYRWYIRHHQFTYDNQGRVVLDSIHSFSRVKYNASQPEGIEDNTYYSYRYKFDQNSMTYVDSRYPPPFYPYLRDTTFFNPSGDINKLEFYNGLIDSYNQYVTEFYPDENPLATLNLTALYKSVPGPFWSFGMDNLNFPEMQPRYLYKKLSGNNTRTYQNNKYDQIEVFFHIQKNSSNKITHLVIANYTHYFTPAGVYIKTNKRFLNYKFFYHQ